VGTDPAGTGREQHHLSADEQLLHKLGYAQELYRAMGGFGNFAISFTIISILAGCLTSYFIAFQNGGPVAVTWGWLLVGTFCTIVALAMAEIASSMPTAGGLYYWSSKLGSPGWGWFTGWFNLIGQISVTAAIDYGAATFVSSLFNLWFSMTTTPHHVFIVYTCVILLHLGINLFGLPVLNLLNTVSAWWHMAGVAVIVLILIVIPDHHQSASFVFTKTLNTSGFSGVDFSHPVFWFVFGIGLLMAQYTITGFDASAHLSEETKGAARGAALGIIMSVVVSVVFGFILLVAVTFAVPDVQGTLGAGAFDVQYIWQTATSDKWAEFMLVIACVAQLFCGAASVTSASRMLFAFSRDGAVPGHQWWRRLAIGRTPVYAVAAICVLAWALMLPTLSNAAVGYLVGTSIAVIGLYLAFVLPIILRWRLADRFEAGEWSLRQHYKWIDPLAIIWIAFICILFLMPTVPQGIPGNGAGFDWNLVNYAPLTVGGAFVLFGGWWLISANRWFKGPISQGDEAELERIEAQYSAGD
jgi:amino acid transporter